MRKILFIIGVLALMAPLGVQADFCTPGQGTGVYHGSYCRLTDGNNNENTSEVYERVGIQFGFDPGLVQAMVVDGGDCASMREVMAYDKMPVEIQALCLSAGDKAAACKSLTDKAKQGEETEAEREFRRSLCEVRIEKTLSEKNRLLNRVLSAYEKEKWLLLNQRQMEATFKASEQYWDGELREVGDAPFDLMVDLNLIDKVLFGSRSQWINDVWKWPASDDDDGGDEPDLGLGLDDEDDQAAEGDDDQPDGDPDDGDDDGFDPAQDCVPEGHPDANTGNGSGDGSDLQGGALCGNGSIDPLEGETCDDGNSDSGDGCSEQCVEEIGGSSDVCRDPNAVDFRTPEEAGLAGGDGQNDNGNSGDGGDNEDSCPAGSYPRRSVMENQSRYARNVSQDIAYPGPFVGGTFRNFPASREPDCPPGYSSFGVESGLLGINLETKCIPTEFCAEFDAARDFLFGPGWEDDEARATVARSIEALFCISLTTANRPMSPYAKEEGCIDCHIRAMADRLEETLLTNVNPLENTTSSFGIGNRFGSGFSMDLNTSIKARPKVTPPKEEAPSKDVDKAHAKSEGENKPGETNLTFAETLQDKLGRNIEGREAQIEAIERDMEAYSLSVDSISDRSFGERITPLFGQMTTAFGSIQKSYESIARSSATLAARPECTFSQ